MSAVASLLAEARAAGVQLSLRADGVLGLHAARKPPEELIRRIKDAKPALVAVLSEEGRRIPRDDMQPAPRSPAPSLASTTWTPEDWRTYYLERAAIREYDGLLPRAEADR